MSKALLRENLKAVIASASAALLALEAEAAAADADEDELEPACPQCGESNPEKLEDTSSSEALNRRTCLSCGTSYTVKVVRNG